MVDTTLRRRGAAVCSRCLVVIRPKRSQSSLRLTRAAFSKPLRSASLSPSPIRVSASMNLVMPPGVKNRSGPTGRPKNMSSLEYRKCSERPSMLCSWHSTACELCVGSTDGSEKNSSLRTMVTDGCSASHSGAGESVAMKMRRIQGANMYTERRAYLSSLICRKRASWSSPSPRTTSFCWARRAAMYSGELPSTQENTRSMSKLMSLAWSANMFSMVGQEWPYRSTVPRTASCASMVRRVREFSMGRVISLPSKLQSSIWTPAEEPNSKPPSGSTRGR